MVSLRRLLACQCLVLFAVVLILLKNPFAWDSALKVIEKKSAYMHIGSFTDTDRNGKDGKIGSGGAVNNNKDYVSKHTPERDGRQASKEETHRRALNPSSSSIDDLDFQFNITGTPVHIENLEENCQVLLNTLKRPTRQKCMGWFSKKGERNMSANLSAPRRIAIIVRGEAFRRNTGMYDRNIEVNMKSMQCQLEASASHVRQLIEPFESCGIEVKVFLQTWKPLGALAERAMQALVDAYQGRVVWRAFVDHKIGMKSGNGQAMNFIAGLGGLSKYYGHTSVKFDATLIIRADLVFKQSLVGLATEIGHSWKHVMFAFHEYEMGGGYPSKVPKQRLPDTIFWVPWLFVNCMLQNGWQEHNWASVSQFVGDYMGLLMKNEYHDANTAVDRNPLYSQACRKEQAYDIHGGFGVGFFSTKAMRDSRARAEHLISAARAFFKQGEPALIPVLAKAYHSWTPGKTHCRIPDFCFGLKDSHDIAQNFTDDSGWDAWHKSIKISSKLLSTHGEVKYHLDENPKYELDRIVFVRDDYTFKTQHFSIYGFDVSNATYIGFGAKDFPSVPTLIITSHAGLRVISGKLPKYEGIPATTNGVSQHLEAWMGLPTVVVCSPC